MADLILFKRSSVSGSVPSASVLSTGELAVNTADGKLFTKKTNGTVSEIGVSSVTDGDKGDITVSSSGSTWTIDAGVVGTSKLGGDITSAGKALLDDADAAAQRTTLGLGTAATSASSDFAPSGAQYVVLTADATLTGERVLTAGNHVTVTNGGSTATIEWKANYRKRASLYSDMNSAADFTNYSSGTGVTNVYTTAAIGNANRFGVLASGTGSTNTGRAGIGTATTDTIVFGSSEIRCASAVNIPTLSNSSQRFTVFMGFNDSQSAIGSDVACFTYSDNVNSGKWQAQVFSNGSGAAVDTGITADTSWHYFEIVVNSDSSSVSFYIDGTLTNTVTSNIPSGTARATGVVCGIVKSVGSTASTLYTDLLAIDGEVSR